MVVERSPGANTIRRATPRGVVLHRFRKNRVLQRYKRINRAIIRLAKNVIVRDYHAHVIVDTRMGARDMWRANQVGHQRIGIRANHVRIIARANTAVPHDHVAGLKELNFALEHDAVAVGRCGLTGHREIVAYGGSVANRIGMKIVGPPAVNTMVRAPVVSIAARNVGDIVDFIDDTTATAGGHRTLTVPVVLNVNNPVTLSNVAHASSAALRICISSVPIKISEV